VYGYSSVDSNPAAGLDVKNKLLLVETTFFVTGNTMFVD
jgi:hypothetical protein